VWGLGWFGVFKRGGGASPRRDTTNPTKTLPKSHDAVKVSRTLYTFVRDTKYQSSEHKFIQILYTDLIKFFGASEVLHTANVKE